MSTDAKRLRLAADLLALASAKFSNHGCNDYDLPADWTDTECSQLALTIEVWNGSPEDFDADDDHRTQMDWLLMRFLSETLRQHADDMEQSP